MVLRREQAAQTHPEAWEATTSATGGDTPEDTRLATKPEEMKVE
jgi:hypothetical protein